MKNAFFNMALAKAARLVGKPGRILLLLGKLGDKLRHVQWKSVDAQMVRGKFLVLGRLGKAYALGRYREVPWKAMLIVLAAIIYFLNPIDLIPDFIPVVGLTDDFGVLLWVYNSISTEVDKFLVWERSTLPSP